jgi:hypothetical protein
MKVAWMQLRRMHAHERDRVPRIVNGDHGVSLSIVVIADGSRQLIRESEAVLVRIKASDSDRPDIARCCLFEDKAVVTGADRDRVIAANINRVVAITDLYRGIRSIRCGNCVIVAVAND